MSDGKEQDVLGRFVQRARRLYSLPAVAMKVIDLTSQAKIDTHALKECIEKDPALSTKILSVVNSSLFGLSQQVADLNQALALLGTKPLRLLVLGFSLPPELLSDVESGALERYWRHTLIKSVAAREISEMVWNVPGDEAFIAGLLQDIGMLALVQDLGDAYATFLDRIYEEGGDLAALEAETLGFDHVKLSAEMLRHWGLPETLIRAAGCPRDAQQLEQLPEQERALPQILHLAELVAEFLIQERAWLLDEVVRTGQQYHQMTSQQLDTLINALEEKVPQLADVLSLDLPHDTDYCKVLLEAYRQLSAAADEATAELYGEAHQAESILAETHALSDAVQRFVSEPPQRGATAPLGNAPHGSQQPAKRTTAQEPSGGPAACVQTDVRGLQGHVSHAVGRCRQARCPVSLILAEVDHFDMVVATEGNGGAANTVQRLAAAVASATGHEGLLVRCNESRLALILEDIERQQGVELARQLVRGVRNWSLGRGGTALSVSAGLATLALPPKNFPAQELIDAAERCMHGVQLSGGDAVKSIDMF